MPGSVTLTAAERVSVLYHPLASASQLALVRWETLAARKLVVLELESRTRLLCNQDRVKRGSNVRIILGAHHTTFAEASGGSLRAPRRDTSGFCHRAGRLPF
jgi:hypothetical protein